MAKPFSRRGHGRSSRYSAYSGGPDPLAPPVDLREALEQIGQDVMEGTSPRRALSEMLRRGTRNMAGADRLAAEANRRRRQLMQRSQFHICKCWHPPSLSRLQTQHRYCLPIL